MPDFHYEGIFRELYDLYYIVIHIYLSVHRGIPKPRTKSRFFDKFSVIKEVHSKHYFLIFFYKFIEKFRFFLETCFTRFMTRRIRKYNFHSLNGA